MTAHEPHEEIVRTGTLSEESLVSAIATEAYHGRPVSKLLVAADLEQRALQIVGSPDGKLEALRVSMACVEVDPKLAAGTWALA